MWPMKKYLKPVKFNSPDNKWDLKTTNSTTVELMLSFYPPNKVFGQEPPIFIHKEEAYLLHHFRTSHSQPRLGYSKICTQLIHPQNRWRSGRQVPEVPGHSPDTVHLLNCPENQIVLTPEYLWTQPSLLHWGWNKTAGWSWTKATTARSTLSARKGNFYHSFTLYLRLLGSNRLLLVVTLPKTCLNLLLLRE